MAGRLQLDLHFALSESYSSTVSRQSADGYQELRTSIEKKFQADYRFDMSFMAQLDSAAQKAGSLGSGLLNQFVDAAGKLTSLNENDLRNFTQSVDRLFNELGKAVGDAGAFAGAGEMLKSSISDFIHMVQGAVADGPPAGAEGLPPPPPEGAGAPPPPPGEIDFQKYYDETTRKFDEALASYLENMMVQALQTMQDYQQSFFDALTKKGAADAPADAAGKEPRSLKELMLPGKDDGSGAADPAGEKRGKAA